MISSPGLDEAVAQIELRLKNAGLGLQHLGRLSLQATSKGLAHGGFAVDAPSTRLVSASNRGEGLAEDAVTVEFLFRIRPHEQLKGRGEAWRLEQQIIQTLTGGESHFYRLFYRATPVRGPHPQTADYYFVRLQFALQVRQMTFGTGA